MNWAAMIPVLLAGVTCTVLLSCAVAWFLLSRWLEGKPLIIASIACSIAAGLGRSSYAGPASGEALMTALSAVTTIIIGLLIGKLWLRRLERQADG